MNEPSRRAAREVGSNPLEARTDGAAEYSPLTISFRFAIGGLATMRDNVVRQAFTVDVFSRCVPSI